MKTREKTPFNLTIEILLRLPARSVARFRLACKLWCSTTQRPDFIEAHLRRAKKVRRPPSVLLAPPYIADIGEFTIFDNNAWISKRRFPLGLRTAHMNFNGSCNGILCMNLQERVYLLNTATGESLTLTTRYPSELHMFQLGFHPATMEYKIIHMVDISTRRSHNPSMGFEVYTLDGTRTWRVIDHVPVIELNRYRLDSEAISIVVNGVMYFFSYRPTKSLLSFDLKDESFSRIPLPSFKQGDGNYSMQLVDLHGGGVCLALKLEQHMEIYRLSTDQDGRRHGWNLMYSISACGGMIPRVPLFIHEDKVLMSFLLEHDTSPNSHWTMLCYVDPKGANEILFKHRFMFKAFVHVESLVALRNK